MTFFKNLFGKKEQPQSNIPTLTWIEAPDNPWGIRLLDLRPITQGMLSTSHDPQMAANAVSYGADDGTSFMGQEPEITAEIAAGLSFPVDPMLAPGVLFAPTVMEHKWAIFFHGGTIIFVRSWLRRVVVTAQTTQREGRLHLTNIKGRFSEDDSPEFTRAIANFLLISHVIGEIYPAPLPGHLSSDPTSAGLWAMSLYGNLAHIGTFSHFDGATSSPLRSQSLLHIAVARSDIPEIDTQLRAGIPLDLLATDGLAPLHWSLAPEGTESMRHLLDLGATPDVRSAEGATPLMNAVQSDKPQHLTLLLSAGANVNARDHRGFTALHRAAEMGRVELVRHLLNHGADPHIETEGHTPLSLAQMRGETEIVRLLHSR